MCESGAEIRISLHTDLKSIINHEQLNIIIGPSNRIVGTVAVNITIYVSFLDSLFEASYNVIPVSDLLI